jgi:hypothetical protein
LRKSRDPALDFAGIPHADRAQLDPDIPASYLPKLHGALDARQLPAKGFHSVF